MPRPSSRTSRCSRSCSRHARTSTRPGELRRHTVANRVLHQRLKQERGRQGVLGVGRDVEVNAEPRAEAGLFDRQIGADHFQLAGQRRLLQPEILQRQPQQVAQPGHHAIGRFHVGVDEGGDGVERIEEEVRLQLALEQL